MDYSAKEPSLTSVPIPFGIHAYGKGHRHPESRDTRNARIG